MKKIEGYAKLIPSGSKPGKLYGQAKVHKSNVPLRPVVSMVDTPEYNLAKYLDNMIKPYIPDIHLLRSTTPYAQPAPKMSCTSVLNKSTIILRIAKHAWKQNAT